jgi:hypothetical protein
MTTINELFPGKYLRASDVTGKSFKAIVERVDVETMRDGAKKAVCYFQDHSRGIVLNRSRAEALVQLARSQNTDDWVGLEVMVCAGETNFAGTQVPSIEFKPARNKVTARSQT